MHQESGEKQWKQRSIERWGRRLASEWWKVGREIWNVRSGIKHGTGVEEPKIVVLDRLENRVRITYRRGKGCVGLGNEFVFKCSLEGLLKKGDEYLVKW